MSDIISTEERIVKMLRTVFDPEIPVNIYDLGLIYKIDLEEDGKLIPLDDVDHLVLMDGTVLYPVIE